MPKKLTLFIVGASALIALIFVYVAVSKKSMQTNGTAQEPVTVRLAWLHQAQFAGMYVAHAEGLYKKAGLDVTFKEFEFETDNLTELANGGSQFAVASAKELMKAIDQGLPVKAVAVIYQVSPYAFAALSSSGIASPADFRGKKLGAEGGSQEAYVTYNALLKTAGLSPADAEIVNLNFDEANDLKEQRADVVDLYRTDQPYRFEKAGLTTTLIYPERYGFEVYGDLLITTDTLIAQKPELVRRFVQATLAGWQRALDDQPHAVDVTMPYTKDYYADRAYQEFILRNSEILIRPSRTQPIGGMQYLSWRKAYAQFREAGALEHDLDASTFYTTQFLK